MDKERKAKEAEEKKRAERTKKIKEQFSDSNSQWEKDKNDVQNLVLKDKADEKERTGSKPDDTMTPSTPDKGKKDADPLKAEPTPPGES